MRAGLLLFAIGWAACSGAEDSEADRITIADVEIAPPPGWAANQLDAATWMWTPPENSRRESITVMVRSAPLGDSERTLVATRTALGVLRDLHVSSSDRIATGEGLAGMRFDLRFRSDAAPDRLTERSHVVVVKGDHVVHVLYTAATPDHAHVALDRVVRSLRMGGG